MASLSASRSVLAFGLTLAATAGIQGCSDATPGEVATDGGTEAAHPGPDASPLADAATSLDGDASQVSDSAASNPDGGEAATPAQDGGPVGPLDPTFGSNGTFDFDGMNPTAIAARSDGRLVLTGCGSTTSNPAVYQVLADGSALDPAFGSAGITSLPAPPSGIEAFPVGALQPDGKILVAGVCAPPGGGSAQACVTRLTTAGALDVSYGPAGSTLLGAVDPKGVVHSAMTLDTLGRAITVTSVFVAGTTTFAVTRVASDGTLDPTFHGGTPVISTVSNSGVCGPVVGAQSNDAIVVGSRCASLVRLTPTGAADPTFAAPVGAETLVVGSDDGLFVAFSGQSWIGVAKLLPGGAFDPSFAGGGQRSFPVTNLDTTGSVIRAVSLGGAYYVGFSAGADLSATAGLVRVLSTGSVDPSFGPGPSGRLSLGRFADGMITMEALGTQQGKLVAGGFSNSTLLLERVAP